jgi:hypothetical protein
MQVIALKYSYIARSSCLRQSDLTSNSSCAVRRRVDRLRPGVVIPGRTIIGTGAHCAVSKRDLALRQPLPEGQKKPSSGQIIATRSGRILRERSADAPEPPLQIDPRVRARYRSSSGASRRTARCDGVWQRSGSNALNGHCKRDFTAHQSYDLIRYALQEVQSTHLLELSD